MSMSFAQPAIAASKPVINPSNFTTNITNPYFSLRPGTTFIYEDEKSGVITTTVVTRETAIVNGVTCVVVHDTARLNGQVIEDTYDWYAQDKKGNVWYFGEATAEFEPDNPIPISTEGSWVAGVDGAQPGIIMKANPRVGEVYNEELAPGVAEDKAKVLSLDKEVDVAYGSFDDALKTKNFTPLDPDNIEHKYYAQGVGLVLGTNPDGGREELVKILVDGTTGNDKLTGYAGGDEMSGLAGRDSMSGLAGNDIMRGGAGDDSLSGGKGADSFIFEELTDEIVETDRITDYRKSQADVIDLPQGALSVASDSLVNGVWQLTLAGDGDRILLAGVTDANHNGHITDDVLFA